MNPIRVTIPKVLASPRRGGRGRSTSAFKIGGSRFTGGGINLPRGIQVESVIGPATLRTLAQMQIGNGASGFITPILEAASKAASGRMSTEQVMATILGATANRIMQHYQAQLAAETAKAYAAGLAAGKAEERARKEAARKTGQRLPEAVEGAKMAKFLYGGEPEARAIPQQPPVTPEPEELELTRIAAARKHAEAAWEQVRKTRAKTRAEKPPGVPEGEGEEKPVGETGIQLLFGVERQPPHTLTDKRGRHCATDRWFNLCGLCYDADVPKRDAGGMFNPMLWISGPDFRCYYPYSTAADFKGIMLSGSSGRWLHSWHHKNAYLEF